MRVYSTARRIDLEKCLSYAIMFAAPVAPRACSAIQDCGTRASRGTGAYKDPRSGETITPSSTRPVTIPSSASADWSMVTALWSCLPIWVEGWSGVLTILSPRPHRFPGGALPVPAIAGDRRAVRGPLAIRSTILAALCCGAVATRMSALLSLRFGHDDLLAQVQYHGGVPIAMGEVRFDPMLEAQTFNGAGSARIRGCCRRVPAARCLISGRRVAPRMTPRWRRAATTSNYPCRQLPFYRVDRATGTRVCVEGRLPILVVAAPSRSLTARPV